MASPIFRSDVLTERATEAGDTTHYAIAVRAGVRESTISRILAGRTMPTLPTLVAIAGAYGVSLDDLVQRPTVPQQRAEAAA